MLLELLEMASNKALEYDVSSQSRLDKLHGKTMVLRLVDLNFTVALASHGSGLEFSQLVPEMTVDVTLSTTLSALVKISRYGLDDAELAPGELDMQGDPLVGQRFAQLIANLSVDWQALLSEYLGLAPAGLVLDAAVRTKTLGQAVKTSANDRLREFIKHEADFFADTDQTNKFVHDVGALSAEVDRLSVRLSKLLDRL